MLLGTFFVFSILTLNADVPISHLAYWNCTASSQEYSLASSSPYSSFLFLFLFSFFFFQIWVMCLSVHCCPLFFFSLYPDSFFFHKYRCIQSTIFSCYLFFDSFRDETFGKGFIDSDLNFPSFIRPTYKIIVLYSSKIENWSIARSLVVKSNRSAAAKDLLDL